MLDRLLLGVVADKPHTVLRDAEGRLLWEECITRGGFDGAFTIVHHRHPPMADTHLEPTTRGWAAPELLPPAVSRRLFVPPRLELSGKALDARAVLLANDDVHFGVLKPSADDDAFLANNDGDDLYYLHEGSALLESPLGNLAVGPGDYLWVPRSTAHRFVGVQGPCLWLHFEVRRGLHLPRQYVNPVGQLKMDAPYSHRDFRRPGALPAGAGPSQVVIKRAGSFHLRTTPTPILDTVGLDGFVYPVAFNILRFQPKTALVHLPPPAHATFAAPGLILCSFVPRVTDTHPQAIPCPYPHSSVDCDEVLFYARGTFTSRRGVGPGAFSLHPAGIPHGPHPGAYEASIGTKSTDELAVMMDTERPLFPTRLAAGIEDGGYHGTWRA